ncbi:zinc finger protein [Saccharopolyspora cebuensis]|uniref:Zinc finger protein n=1 Tax=Saccharopolyspora cebuensis TaxID=418759 RepID=A0ABV4CJG9_9PSEU
MTSGHEQHPFKWTPGAEKRHATLAENRDHGTEVETLCGTTIVVDRGELAWFWFTCEPCNVAAHEIAGVPMPGDRPVTVEGETVGAR